MPSSAKAARRSARAAGYVFPEHLREQAHALPAEPGVYTFHGRGGSLPLYNRLLRRLPRQFSLRLYRGQVSAMYSGELDLTSAPMMYGIYSSERAAREGLRRLADALALLEIVEWPFAGPVAVEECGPAMRQFHVVDGWFYHGSTRTLAAARRLRRAHARLDRDAYRILRKGLSSSQWTLHPL